MEWISTKERLPKEEVKVLALTKKGKYIFTYWYMTNENIMYCPNDSVEYWMPLPKPPKK